MLTKEQLFLIQNKFQTLKENVLREYVQHLFLSSLYRTNGSEKILFKGGTAYRIAYKSPRFSEDLDFSVNGTTIEDIENILMSVLEDLSNNGIVCEIEESKKTTGGYLAKLYTALQGEKVPISLQISLRQKMEKDHDIIDIINEYVPTYTALLLPKDDMIDEKIQAALTRSKPRDFYDIYFLLKNGFLTSTQKNQLIQVKRVLSKKTIRFTDELSHFLPRSMKTVADSFPEPLLAELDKYF
ncbi:nucleotidyl transferase AbiEii/AbiGii toxin family protein [Patescibacteria group bacterium]|nr:nucleotidyl transferase AbiEii/AbiGii toxin family protein [Patescibacteria group bacterium]MBU2459682.1 nucleotidyl transferase AbiEii/AbiGii toxin family protein [Patescibacteria group bacterium]MBU2544594.1 nucleotidyl transferase AbiEii/AbiGii toxin family protein [Patescibacteria group bacterium]